MTKKIQLKRILVPIDKLVTMAELGLGAVRPLNKEKRGWINKLKKQDEPFDPILVTPSGIVIFVILVQSAKVQAEMLVTLSGIVILVRLSQPEKVLSSMLSMLLGMVMLVRLVQKRKA